VNPVISAGFSGSTAPGIAPKNFDQAKGLKAAESNVHYRKKRPTGTCGESCADAKVGRSRPAESSRG